MESEPETKKVQQEKKEKSRQKKEEKPKQLRNYERRINYGVCFFIFQSIAAHFLDADIICFVSFYLLLITFTIFNVFQPSKSAILLGLYFVSFGVGSLSFFLGDKQVGTHI